MPLHAVGARDLFDPSRVDILSDLAKIEATEVRPDVIIGLAPSSNVINCAGPLGYYLSLLVCSGEGIQVPFPGSQKA